MVIGSRLPVHPCALCVRGTCVTYLLELKGGGASPRHESRTPVFFASSHFFFALRAK